MYTAEQSRQDRQPSIEWRIRVVMAERHVKTIADLRRRLEHLGVTISAAQLSRVVEGGQGKRISSDLLAGIAVALDCQIGDLLRLSRDTRSSPANDRWR